MIRLQFPVRGPKVNVVDGRKHLIFCKDEGNPLDLVNPQGWYGTITLSVAGVVKTTTFTRDHPRLQITNFVADSLWNRVRWWLWCKEEETLIGPKPTVVVVEVAFRNGGRERTARHELILQMT